MDKTWEVRVGNIFEILPLSKTLMDALMKKGLSKPLAAWWILRQSIVLGAGDSKYNERRKLLERLLRGGEES